MTLSVRGNNIDIFNIIRNDGTSTYQDRVPVATQSNFQDVANFILSDSYTKNEFLSALYTRIGKVIITSKMYNNPLKNLKKGEIPFGQTVEEIFVNVTKAEVYDYNDEVNENPFARKNPDVSTALHNLNNEKYYQTTVSDSMLRTAFLSETGVQDLTMKLIQNLYTSFEYDEFTETKALIVEQIKAQRMKEVVIPNLDTTNANSIVRTIKEYSNKLRFMSNQFNSLGVTTHTPIEDQYILMSSKFNAMMDVDVLASAFNMNKVEFLGNTIVVDDFLDLAGVECVLVDKDFFMIFDNYIRTTDQYNPKRHYINYFLTTRQTFSVSPFANAIYFTTTGISPEFGTPLVDLSSQEQTEWNGGALVRTELETLKSTETSLFLDVTIDVPGVGQYDGGVKNGFHTSVEFFDSNTKDFITSTSNPVSQTEVNDKSDRLFIDIQDFLNQSVGITDIEMVVSTVFYNNGDRVDSKQELINITLS